MKGLKNKKGFTLIELLAVIVVLAIVMVLATTTVLPYMTRSTNKAFALEANSAIDAASKALTLMSVGSIDEPETGEDYLKTETTNEETGVKTTTYCFSLKKLVDLGLWTKDVKEVTADGDKSPKYAGTVIATKTSSSNAYTYAVQMHNSDLYVNNAAGTVDEEIVLDYSNTVSLKTSCSAS